MTAPYAPTLLSPVAGRGALVNSITFRARYNAPTSQSAGDYQLTRRQLSPTIGSWEYVTDANTWTTTPTDRTAIANVEDADEVEIVIPGAWTADTVYEWRLQFENDTAEQGPISSSAIFVPRAAITMTMDVETPSSDSRPYVRWSASEQRAFRLAVFLKSVYDDPDFDWDQPGWLELATWIMDDEFVSSDVFRKRVGLDLDSSSTYRVIGRVIDEYGVDSGWQAGPEFTQSLTPPTAPTVSFSPDPGTGLMNIIVDSSFNLADADSSGFDAGLGKWIHEYNCELEWVTDLGRVTVTGSTYDEEDTAHTDYNAEDTAHGTYEDQRTFQENNSGNARIEYEGAYTTWIPVTASEDYSAIISVRPVAVSIDVRVELEQYNSGGTSAGATHNGSWITCLPGVWTEVPSGAFSVSGTAAYIRPGVNFGGSGATAVVDDVYEVDNFAIARSDEVAWTPGGNSADLQFTLSRKIGDCEWEYVWNASRENPTAPANSSLTVATIPDGAYPTGTDDVVTYRAVVLSEATGKIVASEIVDEIAPVMTVDAWYLRCVDGTVPDARLRSMDFRYSFGASNEVLHLQSQEFATILESGDATRKSIDCRAWLFSIDEYEDVVTLLRSRKRLYIQRNIGDGFYLWPTGVTRVTQRRAVGTATKPRHLHSIDFDAEVVGAPPDVSSCP